MAYQYDEFGNVIGEYESEEERRQREQQELADHAVQTQEIKTYGDGTVEKVTKESLPPELQRQQAAYQQTVAPVATVVPDQAAYTRQQESGGRRDIGYHFPADAQGRRQSTAFGPYGITEAAYKDIARQDPSLAKPITEWTQEEHDRGYNTLVGRNQARLTQLGIEPTGGALQLSHLLGPDGAARFLKTGEVSEAAAAANGGAERLKQIASGRFAGGASASSGAAPAQPAQAQQMGPVSPEQVNQQAQVLTQQLQQLAESQKPQQAPNSYDEFGNPVFSPAQANLDIHLNAYQGVQDSPDQLLNLSKDPTLPEWLKDRSRNRAADLIIEQRQEARAQKEASELDENKIARIMRERRGEGSRVKGMLYAAFGLTDLANEEKYKLGIGTDKADTINGEPVVVKVAANGKAIDGVNALTGRELTAKEIAEYNSNLGGALGKGASVSAEVYVDQNTGKRYRSGVDSSGKAAYVSVSGGPAFKGNERDLVPQSIGTSAAKAEAAKKISLSYDPIIAAARAGAKELGEANAKYGTNFAIAGYGAPGTPNAGKPILVDQTTNQIVTPDASGKITTTQGAQVAPSAPVVAQGGTAALATGTKVSEAEQTKFVESKKTIGETASGGLEIGNARRQQLDLIKQNPSILNIMNGDGTQFDQARNLIVRMASGAYSDENREALYKDIKALGLGPAEQGALTDFANLNTGINAKTLKINSGAGSISNAEQQANKDANIGNIDRITAYAAMSGLHRSMFAGDLSASKQAFLDKHPELKTDAQFNSAWQKEEANLLKGYQGIAKARFDVMGKPPEANAGKEAMAAYKDRVFRAFEAYPAPKYDSATGTWDYQTANAKRAAMKQILGQ